MLLLSKLNYRGDWYLLRAKFTNDFYVEFAVLSDLCRLLSSFYLNFITLYIPCVRYCSRYPQANRTFSSISIIDRRYCCSCSSCYCNISYFHIVGSGCVWCDSCSSRLLSVPSLREESCPLQHTWYMQHATRLRCFRFIAALGRNLKPAASIL